MSSASGIRWTPWSGGQSDTGPGSYRQNVHGLISCMPICVETGLRACREPGSCFDSLRAHLSMRLSSP